MFKYRFELENGNIIYPITNQLINPTVIRWVMDEDECWINLRYVRSIELITKFNGESE